MSLASDRGGAGVRDEETVDVTGKRARNEGGNAMCLRGRRRVRRGGTGIHGSRPEEEKPGAATGG
jgi:hypothetical protein